MIVIIVHCWKCSRSSSSLHSDQSAASIPIDTFAHIADSDQTEYCSTFHSPLVSQAATGVTSQLFSSIIWWFRARNIYFLKAYISRVAPQAPPPLLPWVCYSLFPIIAACLEVLSWPALRSVRVASRSHVRVASRSKEKNFETKIFNSRWFFGPPTETSFTTPHYYPKYQVRATEFFLW